MSPRLLPVAVTLFALVGCGGAPGDRVAMAPEAAAGRQGDGGEKKGAADQAANASAQPQMIIHTANLDVVVKDLDSARSEVEKLVAGHHGFVARSEVKGDPGSPRYATYTLRVPVVGFAPIKEGILALGTAERNAVETQDVTEEYVDVEARIKNLQEQERKLNELLLEKRKEEKLEDVIKVSDRIFLVRGDIERAQGRRKYLLNRVQLSTINLTLREIKDYKPPTTPTFGTRIGDTFSSSWDAAVDFGQRLVLIAVALAPWAPIWLPLLAGGIWGIRRLNRMSREAAARMEREREARSHRPRRVVAEPIDMPKADLVAEPPPPAPPASAEPARPPEEEGPA